MLFSTLFALALAPLALAIDITSPAANSTLTKGSEYTLSFTSVDTDPTTFSIFLVNFVNFPPYYIDLATDIETSAGSYTVRIPCDLDSSYGYQFNAINGTNVYVIYAQSPEFSIGGADCTDPTTTSSACPAQATVTQTVTVSGSSTLAPSYGVVPKTIGWKSNYSSPVVLATPPVGGQPAVTAAPTGFHGSIVTEITTIWHTVEASPEECGCGA